MPRLRLFAALVLALVFAPGCKRLMGFDDGGKQAEPIPSYPDGAAGLKQYFGDVLTAARKDDRDRVHDLLANSIMPESELTRLFGPEGGKLAFKYTKLMETLVNRGAVELVAEVYERKLDTVEVLPIDPKAADATAENKAIAAALKVPLSWYAVRVRRATDQRGLRYDFWYWRDGKWLTGNQLGHSLDTYHPPPDGGTK